MPISRAPAMAVAIVIALVGAPVESGTATPTNATTAAGVATSLDQAPHDQPATGSARAGSAAPASVEGDAISQLAGGGPLAEGQPLTVPGAQPNIVVFYLDDLNPSQGVLWSNATRTPTMRSLFVDRGVSFPNAIGESPLCCPGRAGLLTGLHTHNHGVTYNDVRLFDPAEHVGEALKESGYDTMWIGKYMNHPYRLSSADWSRHSAGWTQFDVFRNVADPDSHYFYNYDLFTKQGNVSYGRYHSTRMIADRAILRMRQSAPTTPLFMVLSIYDTHGPNLPMPEFKGDSRCQDMPPWKPPNYNEADVSDKPGYVRERVLLKSTVGWSMKVLCEQMLGVDWLIKRVTDELAAQGRLDDTLLVFTADNGMAWGQHRLGQEKQTPYATPVPLLMSWPARWGNDARTIEDIAVNIDLAPTFCALGGCTLGPFPDGQAGPDGLSLLPLLDGTATSVGRDAVLEGNYSKRPFTGLRTTPTNSLGRWHYVEYADGFRELYNLATDPWELVNLAYKSSTASVRSALATRLAQLRREGRPGGGTGAQRPDGLIALTSTGTYWGNNIYSGTAMTEQSRKRSGVAAGSTHDFFARIQNDGSSASDFNVYAESTGTTAMTARFFVGGVDVTSEVMAGSYTITNLAPGAKVTITVRVQVGAGAPVGAKLTTQLRVAAADNPGLLDVVRAVTIR